MTQKYQFKTEPFAHQLEANRRMWKRPGFALLMEMGTGKTKVAIDDIGMMVMSDLIDVAVVLAPKGVYMNWVYNEIPVHLPDEIRDQCYITHWESGGGTKSHQRVLMHAVDTEKKVLLVMNTEALSSGTRALDYVRALMRGKRCAVYVDESTFIKNPSSNRTRRVIQVGKMAEYRRIMTGSPVTRSPLDLFSQFEFLQEGILGSRSFYAFRARYAVMQQKVFGGRKVDLVVGYRNLDDLTDRVQGHSYRVRKEECLTLPPKVYTQRYVELTDQQRRMYSEMREEAFAILETGEFVSATAVITQILRLHQIVCGHFTDADGQVHSLESNRVPELMEVLAEASGKVVIWARYKHDIQKIVEAISKEYGVESVAQYHGGNTDTRQDDARRFINDPSCMYMVSNQQSGGYGNTWIVADTVVYFSNDYDLEKRMQSEDRTHRAGQTRSVLYVDLVAKGTVDEKILHALRNKINIAGTVLGENVREWVV